MTLEDDNILEMLSMLSSDTRLRMECNIDAARSAAVAELAEGDLAADAKELLEIHIKIADGMLLALSKAESEIADIRKPMR